MGAVALTVRDLDRSHRFYVEEIGLEAREDEDGTISLSPRGGSVLVELQGNPAAPPLERTATGLYHLAILLPTRRDLAFALARLSAAGWPLDGASDHLVSEALYLSDPDGNGIELYRDRPGEQWSYDEHGRLAMSTLPLDLNDLVSELASESELPPRLPPQTRIGHIHLQVADLERAEEFYSGVLGFDVVVRHYPGALFVSAGGYHHHIGMNTWHSAGASPPPAGAVGLRSFEVVVPDVAELERLRARIESAGIEVQAAGGGVAVRDPVANRLVLRTS